MMINREQERSALDRLVEGARGKLSGAVVFRGEPGIGKTRLLDYVIDSAGDLVLAKISGVESEMALSYAGLHRLLIPFLPDLGSLPAAQGNALRSALGLGSEAPTGSEPFLVGLATLTLLARVAASRGLLCIIDDAHWVDSESLDALAFVGRRLHADRIVLLFSVREPSDHNSVRLEGIPSMYVTGLTGDDAARLFAEIAPGPVASHVTLQLVEETSGNPLALTELVEELTTVQLSGALPLPEPLPIGPRLETRFRRQVEALPTGAQTLLLVAAADPTGDPDLFWRAMAALKIEPEAVASVEASGLLELRPFVVFRHPLIRSAIYSGASSVRRREVHRVLAAITDRDHDQDRWAWHLAACALGTDEEAAAALEASADRGRRRGGHSGVATVLERAAELTPDIGRRASRYFDAAREAVAAGEAYRARTLLDLALPGVTGATEQAQAQQVHADILRLTYDPGAAQAFLIAARSFQPTDRGAASEAWLAALEAEISFEHGIAEVSLHEMAAEVLSHWGSIEPSTIPEMLLIGIATRIAIGYSEAVPILRRALTTMCDETLFNDARPAWSELAPVAALDLWDSVVRKELLARLAQLGRDQGALHVLALALLGQARDEVSGGRFDRAQSLFAQSEEIRLLSGEWWDDGLRIELTAWRGQDDETRVLARGSLDDPTKTGPRTVAHLANKGLGLLSLAQGRYGDALEHLRQVYEADPLRYGTPILPDLVEAAVRSGEPTVASAAIERLRSRAEATGTPLALGSLARSLALVDDDDKAESNYRESINQLRLCDAAPELARAHLLYGEWLRRENRRQDARRELTVAYDAFLSMGADAFCERTRMELRATGETARKRTVAAQHILTPQEQEVARLASQGATNAEIASQMFLSASTVDFHLRKVYRKFGISSRRALAKHLEVR